MPSRGGARCLIYGLRGGLARNDIARTFQSREETSEGGLVIALASACPAQRVEVSFSVSFVC